MRIIQTINDTIRLLFNPKTEVFCLSDFLLVRDVEENFLAQVVEVYDDKFDQESNVAKIKLIYRIINGNELVPYDNYTPSRECEVAKIKQSEIEKCINLNKTTIVAGKSAITGDSVEINTNFFDNNCIIFADKYEQTNKITECLAPRLSKHKNVLVLDFSGTCDLEGAQKFVSGSNFKMPLAADTIDYIQQKTLSRAKLETQVVLGGIFEEVKNFLTESEEGFIPFSRFIKVIQSECTKTPSVELLVLISWLRKYARLGLFAKTDKEFKPFFNSLITNKLTTLDVSNIKTEWQKEFVEYVINNIQNEVYVLIRLNDNNINNDILNSVYLKKKNISFIPSFAYGYKKASYVMEFAQNYILLPTLNPKRDFNHANFQIQSLNNESFMLFGEDTKDFIFILELKSPIKQLKKASHEDGIEENDKLFISLNLQLDDMTPLELMPSNFELKKIGTNRRRRQEEIKLSDVLKSPRKDTKPSEDKLEDKKEPEKAEEFKDTALISMADEAILGEDELDYFEQPAENKENQTDNSVETPEEKPKEPAIKEQEEHKQEDKTEPQKTEEELIKEIHEAEEKELIQEIHKAEEEELIQEIHKVEEEELIKEIHEAELNEEDNSVIELANNEIEEIEAEIIKQTEKEKEDDKKDLPKIKEIGSKKENVEEDEEEITIADSGSKNELLELAKEHEEKEKQEQEELNSEENNTEEDDIEQEEITEDEIIIEPEIDDNILDAIDEANGIKVNIKEEIGLEDNEEEETPAVETISIEELVEEKIKSAKEKDKAEEKENTPAEDNKAPEEVPEKEISAETKTVEDKKAAKEDETPALEKEEETISKVSDAKAPATSTSQDKAPAPKTPEAKAPAPKKEEVPKEEAQKEAKTEEAAVKTSKNDAPVLEEEKETVSKASDTKAPVPKKEEVPKKETVKEEAANKQTQKEVETEKETAPKAPKVEVPVLEEGKAPKEEAQKEVETEKETAPKAPKVETLTPKTSKAETPTEEKEEKAAVKTPKTEAAAAEASKVETTAPKEETASKTSNTKTTAETKTEEDKAKVKEDEPKGEKQEPKAKEPEKSEEEIAIDKKFDEILSDEAEAETKKEMLKVDEKNSIDLEKIKEEIKKPEHKLPVFDDENNDASGLTPNNFKEGDIVLHDQYGKGNILKVIKYGTRCLLQIEFPEIGKRLLDPKIAKLTIANEE